MVLVKLSMAGVVVKHLLRPEQKEAIRMKDLTIPQLAAYAGGISRSSKEGVKIVFAAVPTAMTDGKTIKLPAQARENLWAVRGYMDHEIGHVRFTDFEHELSDSVPLRNIQNILEDIRIEMEMIRNYPGMKITLKELIEKLTLKHGDLPQDVQPASLFFRYIFTKGRHEVLAQLSREDVEVNEALLDQTFPGLRKRLDPLILKVSKCESTGEAFSLADEIMSLIKDMIESPPNPPDNSEKSDSNAFDKSDSYDSDFDDSDSDDSDKSGSDDSDDSDDSGSDDSDDFDKSDSDDSDKSDPDDSDKSDPDNSDNSDSDDSDKSGSDDSDDSGSDDSDSDNSDKSDPDDSDKSDPDNSDNSDSDDSDKSGSDDSDDSDSDNSDKSDTDDSNDSGSDGSDESDSDDSCKPGSDGTDGAGSEEPIDSASDELAARLQQVLDDPVEFEDLSEMLKKEIEQEAGNEYPAIAIPKLVETFPHIPGNRTVQKLSTELKSLLQAHELRSSRPSHSGSRIVRNRLHRVTAGDYRIFGKKEVKKNLDTAVHILADNSGSMGDYKKFSHCRESSLALLKTLNSVGKINPALSLFPAGWISSFSERQSYQEMLNSVLPIQRHGEKLKQMRYPGRPNGGTPMAPAIRWAASEMIPLSNKRKIIIALTDGEPDDVPETQRSVAEAESCGIEVIGVGILEMVCPEIFSKVEIIRNVEEFPQTIFGLLRDLLI
jgi:nitric oxide reductase activation protein